MGRPLTRSQEQALSDLTATFTAAMAEATHEERQTHHAELLLELPDSKGSEAAEWAERLLNAAQKRYPKHAARFSCDVKDY